MVDTADIWLHIRGEDARYWTVTPDGAVRADCAWPGASERFTMAVADADQSFRDGAHVRLRAADGRLLAHCHDVLRASAPAEGDPDFTLVIVGASPPSSERGVKAPGGETFRDGTRFRLKTSSGRFVGPSEGGSVGVNGASLDASMTLTVERKSGQPNLVWDVALRTQDDRSGGHYVQAVYGGGGEVRAAATSSGAWETFDLLPADRQSSFVAVPADRLHTSSDLIALGCRVHLRTVSGHYVGLEIGDTDRLVARSDMPGEAETFTLCVPPGNAPRSLGLGFGMPLKFGQRIGLRAGNGKFVAWKRGGRCELFARGEALTSSGTFVLEQPLPSEPLPELSADRVKELAERHLAELMESQRVAEVEIGPRVRRVTGPSPRRDLLRQRLHRACRPDTWLGRSLAHLRLLRRPTIFRNWKIIAAVVAIAAWLGNRFLTFLPQVPVSILALAVLVIPVGSGVLILYNEFFRSPQRARQLRTRIRKHPALVLPSAPRAEGDRLIPQDDPLEQRLIPRPDLFEEVMPGILRRNHDVQVIIGEPGSGKTMALVYLAGELAKIGLVPVLVPLRTESVDDIEDAARKALGRQLRDKFLAESEIDTLWFWLRERNRLVALTDDIDQIRPDTERDEPEGRRVIPREPGFVLRRTLDQLANHDLPIIVTARPAGIPAGVAASSIDLSELDESLVVAAVGQIAKEDPGARRELEVNDQALSSWIHQGHLTEAPFYLELLASLFAAGRCPELSKTDATPGRARRDEDGQWVWNPLWVRFQLLESYYDELAAGRIRNWLGIETRERRSTLDALEVAALGMLRATAQAARARAAGAQVAGATINAGLGEDSLPRRSRLEEFIDPDDRAESDGSQQRTKVSVHEVVDTGQRLRVIEHDQFGELQFRHRIMQAYLAARRLVDRDRDQAFAQAGELDSGENDDQELRGRLRDLLDPHHPEKLTTQMTLAFGAIRAYELSRQDGAQLDIYREIMDQLLDKGSLGRSGCADGQPPTLGSNAPEAKLRREPSAAADRVDDDPMGFFDPQHRTDPDNALIMLTTAARIAQVTDGAHAARIIEEVEYTSGATRWTKVDAIRAIAGLRICPDRWQRIWEFARDGDYRVRRAASDAIRADAADAYKALHDSISRLILRAAARSALAQSLGSPSPAGVIRHEGDDYDIGRWDEDNDVRALKALGWILPAVVSGLREEQTDAIDPRFPEHAAYTGDARRSLERLVALAFAGGHYDFEASVAQGFKDDAMRHAEQTDRRISGPGRVAANRQLVADIGLVHAESWYSRMLLHQAVALYAIVGVQPEATLALMAWHLHPARERHPFVRDAGWLARRAIQRMLLGSDWWKGLIWRNEGEVVSHRATLLDDCAAQLVADVTLLLNLSDMRGEDSRAQVSDLDRLPYCLSGSPDRREILGAGCSRACGSDLCPYQEPPPDEPNVHRAVSRAFCRQQREIAETGRQPLWQHISKGNLSKFWQEMEHRTRN